MKAEHSQRAGSGRVLLSLGGHEPAMVRVSPFWRAKNRSNYLICYVNVSGLLAISLVLVIIFMTTPMHPHGDGVDLARVGHPISMRAANKEDAIIIAVTRDGKVFFRNDIVRVEWLPDRVRRAVRDGAEERVYIKSDALAKYGWVKEVLDEVQASGVERVGFLVAERKSQPSPP